MHTIQCTCTLLSIKICFSDFFFCLFQCIPCILTVFPTMVYFSAGLKNFTVQITIENMSFTFMTRNLIILSLNQFILDKKKTQSQISKRWTSHRSINQYIFENTYFKNSKLWYKNNTNQQIVALQQELYN